MKRKQVEPQVIEPKVTLTEYHINCERVEHNYRILQHRVFQLERATWPLPDMTLRAYPQPPVPFPYSMWNAALTNVTSS